MIRVTLPVLLAFAILTFCRPTFSEEDRHIIDMSKLPVESSLMTDFVPKGWIIESLIEKDLNGDLKPDAVLTLIEYWPKTSGEKMAPARNRALVILLQTKHGEFRRVAVARRLLRCSACFGAMAGTEGGSPEIKVVNRVVIVEELWGSRETVKTRLHFRYDSRLRRVVLIGEDIARFDRATGSRLHKSRNLLTGVQLIEMERYDEKLDRLIKIPTKKQRIPQIKRLIEDIDYEEYEQQLESPEGAE